MARHLFSPSWHSVAELKPRLVPQARINRHLYRGKVWYVVQDQSGGRYHRLSAPAYMLVLQMDGTHTVQSVWEKANLSGSGDDCTQGEMVDLLVQLHAADLLQVDTNPDSAALFERYKKKKRATLKQWLLNPMSLKFPLLDPDDFLDRWLFVGKFFFSRAGFFLWLAVVLPAFVLALRYWSELTHNFSDQVLSSSNLLVMALVYPVVKLLHELGHGFAAKTWGGKVHEMGLMFLVFAPIPYVDASSASSFPSKIQRAIVAAAGMMVELFLAALALFVWLWVEPGIPRAVAYNVMIIAGISTLVVNGNPLLRYDAYFILCDLIEIPNLAQRGQKYLTYLWDKHIFGVHDLEPPAETPSERRWLFFYTPLAWCYRTFVTITIIIFVAGEFFIFGVLLAVWGLITLVGTPLWKIYKHVVTSPGLRRQRSRAIQATLGMVAVAWLLVGVIPVPLYTQAQGVVWLPDSSILRAGEGGFFQHWSAKPGEWVDKGVPLFQMEDQIIATELEVARARVTELQAQYRAEAFANPVKGQVLRAQLEREQKVLEKSQERVDRLTVRAQASGVLVAARPQDMPGRYLKKGDQVAYVLDNNALIARVVISQDDIDLVRTRYHSAQLRFADSIARVSSAGLVRQAVGGVRELPTAALSIQGGGLIPTAPDDANGMKTMDRVFFVDLSLSEGSPPAAFGERVHVRFNHGYEPLASQGFRRFRQLFLSHFRV